MFDSQCFGNAFKVLLREIPAPLSIGCGGNSVADDLERLAMTVTVDWRKLRTVCENSRLRIQLSGQLADTITAVLVPEPEQLTDSEIDWPKALKFKFLSIFCEHFHGEHR